MNKTKVILTGTYLAFTVFMMSISRFGFEMYLNNLGSVFLIGLMMLDIRKDVLSKLGFLGLWMFSVLHSFGACYLYSYVPYNDLMIYLFDFDLQSFFGFTRNHYDRLVHFSFGLLLLPATRDLFARKFNFNPMQALFIAFLGIQVFSMVYELFEWSLALSLSEGMAESYNGQQGDMWDAHKDMALALLGSLICLIIEHYKLRRALS
jgi:putative membrane protein